MTIPVLSRRHLFAGTSRSRRRTRFTPAPASAGSTSPTRLQSGCRVWQQCSVRDHQRLPAPSDSGNAIARQTRCHVKSHGRPTARRSPAGSFFGGFRTPAPTPGRSLAFGRHPKPLPKAAARRTTGERQGSTPTQRHALRIEITPSGLISAKRCRDLAISCYSAV